MVLILQHLPQFSFRHSLLRPRWWIARAGPAGSGWAGSCLGRVVATLRPPPSSQSALLQRGAPQPRPELPYSLLLTRKNWGILVVLHFHYTFFHFSCKDSRRHDVGRVGVLGA